jgi:hypothetical protein
MPERLNHKRKLSLKSGQCLWARVFELDCAASDGNLIVRAIGQVDDLGRHLSRQAQKICRPCPFRHDLPSLSSGYGARCLINIRAQFPAERRIDPRHVIESTLNAANLSNIGHAGQGHVDCRPASDVQEVFRGKCLSFAETIDPSNYLISHGLH